MIGIQIFVHEINPISPERKIISYDLRNVSHLDLDSFFQSAYLEFKKITRTILVEENQTKVDLIFTGEFLCDEIIRTMRIHYGTPKIIEETGLKQFFESYVDYISTTISQVEREKECQLSEITSLDIRYGRHEAFMSRDEVD